jgi:amino acid permease
MKNKLLKYINIPGVVILIACIFFHKYFGFSFYEIKSTLFMAFTIFLSYLLICFTFIKIRIKIRERSSRIKAEIHKEEERIKDEKYREWYKEHYDDH